MSNEAAVILEKQMTEFKRFFGRNPGPHDTVFFREQAFQSPESMRQQMIDIMKEAGIDDALIFAYDKCGFILTAQNRKHTPIADEKAWEDAIKEFDEIKNSKTDDPFAKITDKLMFEFFAVIYLISNILFRKRKYQRHVNSLPELTAFSGSFILFCLAKTFKHLKSIKYLLDHNHGEDALILVRAVFENYLGSMHSVNNPHEIRDQFIARVGLSSGEYSYKHNRKGKPIFSKAIDNKTKKEVNITYSFSEMAKRSPHDEDYMLYDSLYSRLSSLVHPDFLLVTDYLGGKSIPEYKDQWYLEVPLLSIFFSILILDSFYSLNIAIKPIQSDIRRIGLRIAKKYSNLFDEYKKTDQMSDLLSVISNRLQKLSVLK